VIGYQDRFVRFGYDWFEQFCERHGTEITVINGETFSPEEELVRDLIAIVTVFSARLHGLRSHKNLIRAAALGKDISDDQGTQDQLHPTPEQVTYFAKAAGTSRFVWNWALAEWDRQYEAVLKPTALKLKKQFNEIRREQFPWTWQVTKNASDQVEMPDALPEKKPTAVGMDVGLNRLATLSTGEGVENQAFLKRARRTVPAYVFPH
jgi:Helix-turn-helix domain